MALVDLANLAGVKLGGFGDQVGGSGLITAELLAANADPVSAAINTAYPVVRKEVISDAAAKKGPFPETAKFASLGPDLKALDISITSITSVATVVTVTTKEVHGRLTGATVFLAEIDGDDDLGTLIKSLNGTTPTITVLTTTTFTLDDIVGVDSTWDYTADTGIVSYVPEIGAWTFAFALPSDYFVMVRQTDEDFDPNQGGVREEYQCRTILNRDGDGFLLLSNEKTDADAETAYIEYCIDQTTFTLFSPAMDESIATKLAAEIAPSVGRDPEFRAAMLAEYEQLVIGQAIRNNQSQSNKFSKKKTNYRGGRTSILAQSPRGSRIW